LSAEGQFGTAKGKITVADFSLRKFQQADFFINNSFIFTTAVLFFSFRTAGCHWD
jgi:hypothetical protein